MKSFFDGHISRLSTVEERISKLEDMPIETFYIEFVKRKNLKKVKLKRTPKNCGIINFRRSIINIIIVSIGEEREWSRRNI